MAIERIVDTSTHDDVEEKQIEINLRRFLFAQFDERQF